VNIEPSIHIIITFRVPPTLCFKHLLTDFAAFSEQQIFKKLVLNIKSFPIPCQIEFTWYFELLGITV